MEWNGFHCFLNGQFIRDIWYLNSAIFIHSVFVFIWVPNKLYFKLFRAYLLTIKLPSLCTTFTKRIHTVYMLGQLWQRKRDYCEHVDIVISLWFIPQYISTTHTYSLHKCENNYLWYFNWYLRVIYSFSFHSAVLFVGVWVCVFVHSLLFPFSLFTIAFLHLWLFSNCQ